MKRIDFWCDLTDISAKTESLVLVQRDGETLGERAQKCEDELERLCRNVGAGRQGMVFIAAPQLPPQAIPQRHSLEDAWNNSLYAAFADQSLSIAGSEVFFKKFLCF